MVRRLSIALVISTTLIAALGAQTPAPPQGRATTPTAPPPPPAAPQAVHDLAVQGNVRLDVIITDTLSATPTTKTVTMLVADGKTAQIRSSQSVPVQTNGSISYQPIGIDVDATPVIRPDGRVLVRLTVQYTPQVPVLAETTAQKPASVDESMTVLLLDGKKTLLTQSADPQSDRKVTLEVTATVVR
jgi:hypothetical protein